MHLLSKGRFNSNYRRLPLEGLVVLGFDRFSTNGCVDLQVYVDDGEFVVLGFMVYGSWSGVWELGFRV